ncbi:MAG: TIGR03943 family protein [Thermincola sp.]|jgi:putative membrane protein|nr:TIGR03943 family protein [Thermincola sp.]MDT3703128.1 TIGR03943 family protein [Thermincola sp.]
MSIANTKRINIEAVLRVLILVLFALFFYEIIASGKVLLYVHPRIVPYIKLCMGAMILISIFMVGDIFKSVRGKVNTAPYILFIIPLIMAFALPAKPLESNSVPGKDLAITQEAQNLTQGNDNTGGPISNNFNTTSPAGDNNTNNIQMQGGTIVINDNNYAYLVEDISYNMDSYLGQKVQLVGFVIKDKDFNGNMFVTARFCMSCCTADLQPLGLICQYDKGSELKKDTWIKITGQMKKLNFKGQKIAVVDVENVVKVDKPKNEYVYPY